jgi:hypothetical protein
MSTISTLKANIRQALRTRLWTVSGIPPASNRKIENVELDLKALAGQTWVREYTRFSDLSSSFLGSSADMPQRYTQAGAYMIDLFFPKGTSTTAADTLEGEVLDAFAPGRTLTISGISVLILGSSASSQQDDSDGWYFRPLLVRWECHVVQ